MADYYYSKEHCHFFTRTGACQFGNRCSRIHTYPTISHTLILPNMYHRPDIVDPTKLQEHFEDFYEDIFQELSYFGEIESLSVCDNLVEHMIGNVYVVFKEVQQAAAALHAFRTRAYCGRDIVVEFLAVRNIGLVRCREFKENVCNRGSFCNYMHERLIGRGLWKTLFGKGRRDYSGGCDSGRGMGQYCGSIREISPVRERSEDRRARIETWNREREGSVERRARIEMWNREREGSVEPRGRMELWNREREKRR